MPASASLSVYRIETYWVDSVGRRDRSGCLPIRAVVGSVIGKHPHRSLPNFL